VRSASFGGHAMSNCYICSERDGWGHMMTDYKGHVVPICSRHWKTGCEKCGQSFNGGPDRRPIEVRLMDNGPDGGPSDESQVWCADCVRKAEMLEP
jgi:hypothetical protein